MSRIATDQGDLYEGKIPGYLLIGNLTGALNAKIGEELTAKVVQEYRLVTLERFYMVNEPEDLVEKLGITQQQAEEIISLALGLISGNY